MNLHPGSRIDGMTKRDEVIGQKGVSTVEEYYLNRADRVIYWDKFSRPATPVRSGVMTSRWWYDTQKATALEQARQ